jgi:hypothetical protein
LALTVCGHGPCCWCGATVRTSREVAGGTESSGRGRVAAHARPHSSTAQHPDQASNQTRSETMTQRPAPVPRR